MGFLTLKEPIELYSSPLEVKPPTGEPDAGNPLVRFGGGRGREFNRPFLPLSNTVTLQSSEKMKKLSNFTSELVLL